MINEILDKIVINDAGEVIDSAIIPDNISSEEDNYIEENNSILEPVILDDEDEVSLDEEPSSEESSTVEESTITSEESEDDEIIFKEMISSMKEDFFPDASDEDIVNVQSFEDMKSLMTAQFQKELEVEKERYVNDVFNNLVKDGIIKKSQIPSNLISITKEELLEDEQAQKEVIRKLYTKQGVSERAINKLINNIVDLEEEALEAYDELENLNREEKKNIAEKLKQDELTAKQNALQFTTTLKTEISNLATFIPDKKLSDKDKDTLYLNINPTLEKIGKNPAKYYAMLAYLNSSGALDGDFSKLLKKGESIATKKQAQILLAKRNSSGERSGAKNNKVSISNKDIPSIYGRK